MLISKRGDGQYWEQSSKRKERRLIVIVIVIVKNQVVVVTMSEAEPTVNLGSQFCSAVLGADFSLFEFAATRRLLALILSGLMQRQHTLYELMPFGALKDGDERQKSVT